VPRGVNNDGECGECQQAQSDHDTWRVGGAGVPAPVATDAAAATNATAATHFNVTALAR